jgi:hypothetical protein
MNTISPTTKPFTASEILKLIDLVEPDLARIKQRDALSVSGNMSWSYTNLYVTVLASKVRITSDALLCDEDGKTIDMKLEDWDFPANARVKRFLKANKFIGESIAEFKTFFAAAARHEKLKALAS